MLGIIGAMELETKKLCARLENPVFETVSGIKIACGKISGRDVVIAQCSEGKVNAAVAAQTLIMKYKADSIINTGVAGGLSDEMKIADIAVATGAVEHDFDVTPLGYKKGEVCNLGTVEIPCDKEIAQLLYECAALLPDTKVFKGIAASGDQFINSSEMQNSLRREFGAICAEMEGAAIAHVCFLNKVPCGILRAISDKADDDSDMDFPAFAQIASDKTVDVILNYIKEMR